MKKKVRTLAFLFTTVSVTTNITACKNTVGVSNKISNFKYSIDKLIVSQIIALYANKDWNISIICSDRGIHEAKIEIEKSIIEKLPNFRANKFSISNFFDENNEILNEEYFIKPQSKRRLNFDFIFNKIVNKASINLEILEIPNNDHDTSEEKIDKEIDDISSDEEFDFEDSLLFSDGETDVDNVAIMKEEKSEQELLYNSEFAGFPEEKLKCNVKNYEIININNENELDNLALENVDVSFDQDQESLVESDEEFDQKISNENELSDLALENDDVNFEQVQQNLITGNLNSKAKISSINFQSSLNSKNKANEFIKDDFYLKPSNQNINKNLFNTIEKMPDINIEIEAQKNFGLNDAKKKITEEFSKLVNKDRKIVITKIKKNNEILDDNYFTKPTPTASLLCEYISLVDNSQSTIAVNLEVLVNQEDKLIAQNICDLTLDLKFDLNIHTNTAELIKLIKSELKKELKNRGVLKIDDQKLRLGSTLLAPTKSGTILNVVDFKDGEYIFAFTHYEYGSIVDKNRLFLNLTIEDKDKEIAKYVFNCIKRNVFKPSSSSKINEKYKWNMFISEKILLKEFQEYFLNQISLGFKELTIPQALITKFDQEKETKLNIIKFNDEDDKPYNELKMFNPKVFLLGNKKSYKVITTVCYGKHKETFEFKIKKIK